MARSAHRAKDPVNEHDVLLSGLQRQVDDVLRPLVASASATALLDFPSHSNVGDSAIWLGQLASLRRIGAPAPRYTCDIRSYDRRALARCVGDGVIMLCGGGNFGDLWERHQLFRERVISDFPGNPIVQLSQSIHFQNHASLTRARDVFNRHARLTLLLRDAGSLAIAQREFTSASLLAPDMAFGLHPLPEFGVPVHDVLWLKRRDQEDRWAGEAGILASARHTDWVDEDPTPLIRVTDAGARMLAGRSRVAAAVRGLLSSAYPRIARTRLKRGVLLLRSARVVVTDRLHGHILCMLLGIPHVVLDNNHGKLSRFMAAWTARSPLVRLAATPAAAAQAAAELLAA